MITTVYIETAIADAARTKAICQHFANAMVIPCERYSEIFNHRAQNFRLQKQSPALILAKKHQQLVLPVPPQYGLGARYNYYFSHMLNCLYDCRYCFLQGKFQSAHYVLFVNYEDFIQHIEAIIRKHHPQPVHFFSGYDCDSLAFDPISNFVAEFLPLFKQQPQAVLELRTKSTQIRGLLNQTALPNCVVAFSLTPDPIAQALEHKTPPIAKRIAAMQALQQAGWPLGLRFDPLIYTPDYAQHYQALFEQLFSRVDCKQIHSVSLGRLRLPKAYFQQLTALYPDAALFSSLQASTKTTRCYPHKLSRALLDFCRTQLLRYLPATKLFLCD